MLHSQDLRAALSWVIQDIHRRGWATGTGGNFSAVLDRQPLRLLMAPSGVDKGFVAAADLLEVDAQGQVLAGQGKASAETALHLTILEATAAAAVLHTHSVFATLLSTIFSHREEVVIAGYEMLKGLEGITTHNAAVQVPIVTNSQDMQLLSQSFQRVLQRQPQPHGILVAGHGLYTWGDSLFQARRHLEILEFLFELIYRKQALHGT